MKKTITILSCLLFLSHYTFAQIAPESIAPDFTATDINGVEHKLYDLLDEGKIVILDVFATWCGPCWRYHTEEHLKDVFNNYGPDGTDEMYVFSIEGDGNTNLECLYDEAGCTGGTTGDWVTGTPYPIIESREIALDYQINYYPTIFMVYPNRLVSEIGQLNEASIVALKDLAPQLSEGINPIVLKDDAFNGSVCSNVYQHKPYYMLSNSGEETITSATIEVFKNEEQVYTKDWVGEAQPYAVIEEIRAPSSLVRENTTFELRLSNINGNSSETRSFYDYINFETTSTILVSVQTDANSEDHGNYYEIFNSDGNLIVSEDLNEANALIENRHVLTEVDCYEFRIYDQAGNGIDGEITVHDDEGNLIYKNDGFESQDFNNFEVTTLTSNQNVLENVSFQISPNPARDNINLSIGLDKQETFQVSITNITGQTLITRNNDTLGTGINNISIDVSNLTNGVYFVKIENENGLLTKRLVIN